jgi:hypothetical protein
MASSPPGWINPARRCKPCLRNVVYRDDPNAHFTFFFSLPSGI